jgi:GH35 family endo-1,4-beta-xylanase
MCAFVQIGKEKWESLTAARCDTATYCSTLQHTTTHYNTQKRGRWKRLKRRKGIIDCNTLQHTATHCNTLQHREEMKVEITEKKNGSH